ncbi:MAG: hypothetical protein K2X39_03400, partial [Silvanigrellaceae bacterium]|nr:hypothetical protein [Silvanigrellaceae bacterium]
IKQNKSVKIQLMNEIKEYSSPYATKLTYILNEVLHIKDSIINSISNITNEKDSTTKNWLFNGKIPREYKRLSISDALGVSEDYLFNDNIEVTDIKKPEIVKREGCYLVPFIEAKDIFYVKNANNFPITKRIPIMLPSFDKIIDQYGKNIYATKIIDSNFQPYIDHDSMLICSENITLDEYKFLLFEENNFPLIKRVIFSQGKKKLLVLREGNEEIEDIYLDQSTLLIILSFSEKSFL